VPFLAFAFATSLFLCLCGILWLLMVVCFFFAAVVVFVKVEDLTGGGVFICGFLKYIHGSSTITSPAMPKK